jgi:hypothetical protein
MENRREQRYFENDSWAMEEITNAFGNGSPDCWETAANNRDFA